MKLLVKRNEPGTLGTKSALLKAVINNAPEKKPEEIEKNLMNVEKTRKEKKQDKRRAERRPEERRSKTKEQTR